MAYALSGSAAAQSMQVNVDILGGVRYGANGQFEGLPNKSSPNAAKLTQMSPNGTHMLPRRVPWRYLNIIVSKFTTFFKV